MTNVGDRMKAVDVGALVDEGRWSGYQKLLIFGTALTIILDGIDNQLLPNAVPTLMREWNLPRPAFANVLAAGPFGMMVGGLLGGVLGDRLGRRTALLGSVVSFAVLTLLIALADSLLMLGFLRFLAGVGLGGAMPNAAALASEYVPRRQRPFAVTLTIVCIPLGGTLAALLAGRILPAYGWRALFVIGGLVPVALGLVLWTVLPESPRYLVGRRSRWSELRTVLRRMGHEVPPDASFSETTSAGAARAKLSQLFTDNFRLDTMGLFGAFFFCLMANYIGFQLIPAVLTGAGYAPIVGTNANAAFNFGGVAGAILGALVIQQLGSRTTMLGMSALAIVSALVMAATPLDPGGGTVALITMFAITGGLLNAVQTTMYALAAHVYPTEIRGTGVGTAVAFGRIGNVLAVYAGNFALDVGGYPGYFSSWAVTMALVFGSLALVRRHIPRSAAA
jgi:AAHS family 4-hydroxybenzoate transporter-like MFS transporter